MEEIEHYKRAGAIAADVMKEALPRIEAGMKLVDLARFVEDLIVERGGKPAFPCNISVNDIAAHYSPLAEDSSTFSKGDLVKLDIGVHVEGYIADIARSKAVGGGHEDIIRASEKALEAIIATIKPGVRTNEIGALVEDVITSSGFRPISNLTGHVLSRWNLHGGALVPNVRTRHSTEIREGDAIALEPFATNGLGRVVDESEAIIFRYIADRPLRMKEARDILAHVKGRYDALPFAERWISHLMPKLRLTQALRQLVQTKALHAYHILREKERGLVSQAEDTVIVTADGCTVITRI